MNFIINGDFKSRTEFFTYGLTSIRIGVLGDKGIGKAGTAAKAIGNSVKSVKAAKLPKKVVTPALANVSTPFPYNAFDNLLAQIKKESGHVRISGVPGKKKEPRKPSEGLGNNIQGKLFIQVNHIQIRHLDIGKQW